MRECPSPVKVSNAVGVFPGPDLVQGGRRVSDAASSSTSLKVHANQLLEAVGSSSFECKGLRRLEKTCHLPNST